MTTVRELDPGMTILAVPALLELRPAWADADTLVRRIDEVQRPQGYRLNPDVMEAKRQAHSGGRPVRQATESPPPDCRTVGPFPCFQPGINILAAAATAAPSGQARSRSCD